MFYRHGCRPVALREEIFRIPDRISDLDDRAYQSGFYTEIKTLVSEARAQHLLTVDAYMAGGVSATAASLRKTEEMIERAVLLLGTRRRFMHDIGGDS